MPRDRMNRAEHRGFGFVTFETEAAIIRVASYGGHMIRYVLTAVTCTPVLGLCHDANQACLVSCKMPWSCPCACLQTSCNFAAVSALAPCLHGFGTVLVCRSESDSDNWV